MAELLTQRTAGDRALLIAWIFWPRTFFSFQPMLRIGAPLSTSCLQVDHAPASILQRTTIIANLQIFTSPITSAILGSSVVNGRQCIGNSSPINWQSFVARIFSISTSCCVSLSKQANHRQSPENSLRKERPSKKGICTGAPCCCWYLNKTFGSLPWGTPW